MQKILNKTIQLPDGREITIETGKLAKQADGSVVVKMGKTMLLATVVSAKEGRENADFMPLSVDYQEKFAAIGRFPGGFLKREGRPGDNEVLISRLVDRALRPLFPDDYHAETFVTINLISAEKDSMPDSLAGLAASAALTITDIPFNGPISEVRVGRVNGQMIVNPTYDQIEQADIDIMVGATLDNVLMVEGEMDEVSEAEMLEAIKVAHDAIKVQCQVQLDMAQELEIGQKRQYEHETNDEQLRKDLEEATRQKVDEIAHAFLPKQERTEAFDKIKEEFIEAFETKKGDQADEAELAQISRYYHDVEKEVMRKMILDDGLRLDQRQYDQVRPIWCEVDYLPAAHGSAIFTRGETQSLTTVTLGTKLDEKIVDQVLVQGTDKFLLHYNFPPFATGDARPTRGVSRREVGHGNLAMRSLYKMLPKPEDNPYSLRVVSDILESNGSSSMATVCAGTLALMDAGIQIKKPVSGIAMGLITGDDGKIAVLSDILGDEDHLGDMDFKVAGTKDGITACQMDIKVEGLSYQVLQQALEQAKQGRLHILEKMLEVLPEPRADLKPHAPRIESIAIPKDMIGAIIGPGGKVIQQIQSETETVIVVEETETEGMVSISGRNKEAIDKAMAKVQAIVEVPEAGKVYEGIVKSIVNFGAFVEIMPGKEGLLHISEVEWRRIDSVEDVLKVGDKIEVKLIEVDNRSGKLKLSRKALLPRPERSSNPRQQNRRRY